MDKGKKNIGYMLEETKNMAREYNRIDNWLHSTFDFSSAEIALLITTYEKHRKEILKLKKAD